MKLMRKSLVTLPMGICIPPSIKAIMGRRIASGGLLTDHFPYSPCLNSTPSRILYFSLKVAMPSGVSTSLVNLSMCLYQVKVRRKRKRKRKRKRVSFRAMDERPKALTSDES